MSCRRYRRSVALWTGGDLPAGRAARVEAHLAGCGECRALATEVRRVRATLAPSLESRVDDRALVEISAAVTTRIRAGARPTSPVARRWTHVWAVGALALLVALGALVIRRAQQPSVTSTADVGRSAPTSVPPRIAAPTPRALPAFTTGRGARTARATNTASPAVHKTRRAIVGREAATQSDQLVIKLVTDDPSVVIYWLVDQKKG